MTSGLCPAGPFGLTALEYSGTQGDEEFRPGQTNRCQQRCLLGLGVILQEGRSHLRGTGEKESAGQW